jgi:type IV secretion system protein TrbI
VTDEAREQEGPSEAASPPKEMRLRAKRPPVTRLSRKVLLGVGAAAAIGVGAALLFALKPQHQMTGNELFNTNNRNAPDGLANLPRDYTGLPKPIPQLGPPLPGDLGKPILNAGAAAPNIPMPGPSPEEQRLAQELEAARASHLFATTNVVALSTATAPSAAAGPSGPTPANISSDLTSQDHKLAFLNGNIDRRTTSPDRVQPPAGPYVLQAGAVIPASWSPGCVQTCRGR